MAQTSEIVCRMSETPRPSADTVRKLTVLKLGVVAASDISRDAPTDGSSSKEVVSRRMDEKTVVGEYIITDIADSNGCVEKVVVDNMTADTKVSSVCDAVDKITPKYVQEDTGGVLEACRCSGGSERPRASKAQRPGRLVLRTDRRFRSASRPVDEAQNRKRPDSPSDENTASPDAEIVKVELPLRYRKRIDTTSSSATTSGQRDIDNEDNLRRQENMSTLKSVLVGDSSQVDQEQRETETGKDREQDMSTAFEWVKQELRHMKEDDRHLARKLLELRASLHQMRGLTDCQSFNSDEYDLDPDWSSSRSLDLDPALTVRSSSSPSSTPVGRLLPDLGMRIPSELVNSDSLLSTRHAIRQEFYV